MEKNISIKKTKVIQCIDCGEWFEIDIMSKSHRCRNCQDEENKRVKREYKRLHSKKVELS